VEGPETRLLSEGDLTAVDPWFVQNFSYSSEEHTSMDIQLSEKRRRSIQMREEGFKASAPTFVCYSHCTPTPNNVPGFHFVPQTAQTYKAVFASDDPDRKVQKSPQSNPLETAVASSCAGPTPDDPARSEPSYKHKCAHPSALCRVVSWRGKFWGRWRRPTRSPRPKSASRSWACPSRDSTPGAA
jgi:hypothetical protein